MMRLLVPWVFLCGVVVAPYGLANTVDVTWLVDRALENSQRLKAVEYQIRQEEVEVDIARDQALPALSGFVEQSSKSETRQQLRLSQTVYDWGVASAKIDAATLATERVRLEYVQVREEVAEDTLLDVLDWFSSLERQQVLESHVSRLEHLQRLTASRVGGVVDRGELSRVMAAIAGAKIDLAQANAALEASAAQVFERIGQPVYMKSLGELPAMTTWFSRDLSMTELAKQIPSTPQILEADLKVAKARAEKEVASAEWRPRLSLDAIAERTEDRFGSDTDQRIALRIEAPVFQGLSAFRRPRAANYAVTSAIHERDRSLNEMRRTVQRLISSLNLQSTRAPLIDQQIRSARATVELYSQQFGVGRRDMSDLIGAETERLNAELAEVDVHFEQQRLALRLAGVLGLLTQKLKLNGEEAA